MVTQHDRTAVDMQVAGDRLIADIYTPPDGPGGLPVVLIHGWGGSGSYWSPTIARLRDRFQLIAPDLPGNGRSRPAQSSRTIFDQMRAVEALLEELQIERAMVVGHSLGGGIAILLAAQRPDLVERLALVGVSLFRNDIERQFFAYVTEIAGMIMRFRPLVLADLPLLTRQFAVRFFHRVPDDPETLRAGLLDFLTMDYDTALASARSANHPAINEAAGRIACPTLVIAARQDRVMPVSNIDCTLATIPGSRVHWIDECGHLPMVEKPDEFAAILGGFLGQAPAA